MNSLFLTLALISIPATLGLPQEEVSLNFESKERDPDTDKKTPELIKSRGYVCEEHFIKTTDGYILGIQRIINPFIKQEGRPVLVWHGLLSSSRDFLINDGRGHVNETTKGTGNNLGFELAKQGYDVWLGNTRGNTYSRNHTKINPEKRKFWDYSYDQMIQYDVPDTIDYILKATGKKTLAYVGHSQGTMIMFGTLTSFPKYNDIVKPFIALAPVTSVDETLSPITHLAYIKPLLNIVRAYGGPFLPAHPLITFIGKNVCGSVIAQDICTALLFLGNGFDYDQWNQTRIRTYISGVPAGTSSKNIIHFAQNVRSGIFRKFDYGNIGNLRRYKQLHPPKYQLENITNKDIAVFSAANDWLASPGNVDRIRKGLKVKLMDDYVVPRRWNHIDFLLGLEAGKYVNERLIAILEKYKSFQ